MSRLVRGCVFILCIAMAAAAPEAGGGASDVAPVEVAITLSPVEPMNGRDAGGLGGIHKVQFAHASLVLASPPRAGQSPSDVLTAGTGFKYLRRYGVATFGGTETGGRVRVRFYFYSGYSYRFTCYVGLPDAWASDPASGGMFGFKVSASAAQDGAVKLSRLSAKPVPGLGDPPKAVGKAIALGWDVDAQALPGAAAMEIVQLQKTAWSFHACTVARRKA